MIEGRRHGEAAPDAIVAVVDATNLRMNLRLVLELAQLGRPLMVALNMADVARAEGLKIDVDKLAAELGCPVVETVAVRADGHAELLALLEARLGQDAAQPQAPRERRGDRPTAARAKRARRPTCSTRCAASSPSPRRARRRCAASSTASTRSSCIRSGGWCCSASSCS